MTEPVSRTIATHQAQIGARRMRSLSLCATLLAVACMAAAQTAPHARKPHAAHKSPQAVSTPEPPPQAAPAPQPEEPKWPVNDAPQQPSVTWDAQGLHIQATNSSLSKILADVSTQTGAKVEGLNGDERVFGEYGPGQARDVLTQLLHGSGYNFLLLGDQGQGTPREVILTRRRAGTGSNANSGANSGMNPGYVRSMPDQQQDEDQPLEQPDQPDQVEPPQVIQPPVQQMPPNQDNNNQMTPQQRMQMMQQQRMQQLQQMQQQQQQQQPQ